MSASDALRLTDAQRVDWLRLIRSENVGPRTFRALINHYGSARSALEALPALARRGGAVRPARIATVSDAERELTAARRLDAQFIALGETDYPNRLQAIDDAPPLLAARGRIAALARQMIALVGSRNASAAGIKFAERLARDLGDAGFVIVSGLARGIDAAGHRVTLDTGSIAVLAGGHDKIYPPEHKPLLDSLLIEGVAVSEMPFGWEPRARDFPRRNRIISGLSLGVVVIEAARRSGSLITARLALEQGREVFAVPGSPLDPRAEGTNALIKAGATLITEAADIISAVTPIMGGESRLPIEEDEPSDPVDPDAEPDPSVRTRILGLLGPTPVTLDDLIRLADASAADVRTVLFELEIAGRLTRQGGALVSLTDA